MAKRDKRIMLSCTVNSVVKAIEGKICKYKMQESIHEMVIAKENVIEIKDGKKVVSEKRSFPGYISGEGFTLQEQPIALVSCDSVKDIPGCSVSHRWEGEICPRAGSRSRGRPNKKIFYDAA